jgi:hypothetical protein
MQISVHRAQMMSLRRPVAWTAWTNSMSSQELVVVRSSGLSSVSRSASSGRVGCPRPVATLMSSARPDFEGLDGADGRDGVLDQERAVHRPDSGQLGGLVVDEQERCVLRRDEMVGDRVAHGRAGHGSLTFS